MVQNAKQALFSHLEESTDAGTQVYFDAERGNDHAALCLGSESIVGGSVLSVNVEMASTSGYRASELLGADIFNDQGGKIGVIAGPIFEQFFGVFKSDSCTCYVDQCPGQVIAF